MELGPHGLVTMFDDHCCQLTGGGNYVPPTAPSRSLVLRLNLQTHTASFVADYGAGQFPAVDYMGDTQLRHGNVFVGWGSAPYFSEFHKGGKRSRYSTGCSPARISATAPCANRGRAPAVPAGWRGAAP